MPNNRLPQGWDGASSFDGGYGAPWESPSEREDRERQNEHARDANAAYVDQVKALEQLRHTNEVAIIEMRRKYEVDSAREAEKARAHSRASQERALAALRAGPPSWVCKAGWVGAGLLALYFLSEIFGDRRGGR